MTNLHNSPHPLLVNGKETRTLSEHAEQSKTNACDYELFGCEILNKYFVHAHRNFAVLLLPSFSSQEVFLPGNILGITSCSKEKTNPGPLILLSFSRLQ